MNLPFDFARPWVLWFGFSLLSFWLIGRRRALPFPSDALLRNVAEPPRWVHLPKAVLVLSLALLLLATAGPLWLERIETQRLLTRDLVIALDLSWSMESAMGEGKKGDRKIDVAREAVLAFVGGRTGDRVALIEFGDEAYGAWPLTHDLSVIRHKLAEAGSVFLGGTDLAEPVLAALDHFEEMGEADGRVLLLVTDGDAPIPDVKKREMIERLTASGVRVYLVGIQLKRAEDIIAVVSAVGGSYFPVLEDRDLSAVLHEIDSMERTMVTLEGVQVRADVSAWFAVAGLLALVTATGLASVWPSIAAA